MSKKTLSVEEIKVRCELVGLTYVSHHVEKQTTIVIAKCQCGETVKTRLSNITKYVRENKTYSCKECGRKKTSEAQKGKLNHMYGKKGELHHSYGTHMSEEQKTKISDTVKRKYENGYVNPNYGKKASKETRRKMSENHADVSGEKNPMYGVHSLCGEKNPMYGLKGELHPAYKHDLTDEDRQRKRLETGYTEWTKQVKEQANYTCDCCGKRGGNLHSHHLNDYHSHKELATDVDNGVCLCEHCHTTFHTKHMGHSRIPCTEQDYKEFKQRYLNNEFNNEELDSTTNVA